MGDRMLSLWKDESGHDLADYALLLALIALALIVVISAYGEAVQARFTEAARTLHFRP